MRVYLAVCSTVVSSHKHLHLLVFRINLFILFKHTNPNIIVLLLVLNFILIYLQRVIVSCFTF